MFYLCMDNELLADLIRTDLAYLKSNWRQMGCPTVTLPLLRTMLGDPASWEKSPMFRLLLDLKSGYTNGVRCVLIPFLNHPICPPPLLPPHRVQLGSMSEFISTSHVVPLSFLDTIKPGE